MNTLKKYKRLFEKSAGIEYKYHSTQLNLEDGTSEKDFSFYHALEQIPDSILHHEINEQGKDEYGKETNAHITLLYGLKKEKDYFEVRRKLKDFGIITLEIGEIGKFEHDDYDVLLYEIISPQLEELHEFLKENFDNDFSWPTYNPHMTLAYIQKGKGNHLLGYGDWTGREYSFSNLIWSHIDKFQLSIPLVEDSEIFSPLFQHIKL